jgi:hypothetical protein
MLCGTRAPGTCAAYIHAVHQQHCAACSVIFCFAFHVSLCPSPPRTAADRYMAPEVFRHELYNHKVDQYAFAMIAYQLFQVWGNWLSSSRLTGCCFDWGHTHTHTHTRTHAPTHTHAPAHTHTRRACRHSSPSTRFRRRVRPHSIMRVQSGQHLIGAAAVAS